MSELVCAAVMRAAPAPNEFVVDEVAKLFRGFLTNDPGAWEEFLGPERTSSLALPPSVQRRLHRPDGSAEFNLGPKIHAHIENYVVKLTKALYYMHFDQIVPATSAIEYSIASNAEVGEPREESDRVHEIPRKAHSRAMLKRSNKSADLRSVRIFLSRQRSTWGCGLQDPLPSGFDCCFHGHSVPLKIQSPDPGESYSDASSALRRLLEWLNSPRRFPAQNPS